MRYAIVRKSQPVRAVLFVKNLATLARFYRRVAGMKEVAREKDHVLLESGMFQLVMQQVPKGIAKNIVIEVPPRVREAAATKLSLPVKSLAKAREIAASLGGALLPQDREWSWAARDARMCDGHDPEGNVFQLAEPLVRPQPARGAPRTKSVAPARPRGPAEG
jgi:catechol 2,3-dioxygenase-like lactoylglutathione lyase family enzyme